MSMKWFDVVKLRMKELDITQDEVADLVGLSRAAVGHWLNGRRQPRADQLKKVATRLNLSLDDLMGPEPSQLFDESRETAALGFDDSGETTRLDSGRKVSQLFPKSPRGEFLAILRLNVRASMGHGAQLPDHIDVVDVIRVRKSELSKLVSYSSPSNLRLLTAYGDSMKGTFSDGDVLLVDTGITEIKVDAVYVLSKGAELFVKRLQRLPSGKFLMISDNPLYRPIEIDPAAEGFTVDGRVLLVWNAQKL